MSRLSRKENVDRGWAWVILITAFISRVVIGGLLWAVNQYFVLFHNEFGQSRTVTAIIGSITFATYYSAAPLASMLIQSKGLRFTTILGAVLSAASYIINYFANGVVFLILTHGLLLGTGLCLTSNTSLISIGDYFRKFRYIVTGVSLAGSGVGTFAFAVMIPELLNSYGWRGSMFIMAGIVLQMCICGSSYYSLEPETKVQNEAQSSTNVKKKNCFKNAAPILATLSFWCLNLAQFFLCLSVISVIVLYKDFALVRGFYSSFAWSVASYGIGDIIGRIFIGFLLSFPCCDSSLLLFVCGFFCAVFYMVLFVVTSAVAFIICSFVIGFVVGGQVSLHYILPDDVFGHQNYVVALGYVQTTAGIGSLLGPPLAGFITDADPSYSWTFIFISILQLISSLLVLFVFILQRMKKEKASEVAETQNQLELQLENVAFVSNSNRKSVKRGTQISLELFLSTTSLSFPKK